MVMIVVLGSMEVGVTFCGVNTLFYNYLVLCGHLVNSIPYQYRKSTSYRMVYGKSKTTRHYVLDLQ